jgi:hypothetical protein
VKQGVGRRIVSPTPSWRAWRGGRGGTPDRLDARVALCESRTKLGEPKLPQHTNLREGCDFVVCSRVCAIAQRLLEGLFSGVAGSSTGLQAYFNGRVNWAIQGLEQIVYELRDRLAELEEAARAVNTRTVAGHAVWSSYHEVTCRYRRLEADIIRQILTELDLQRRRALEEAVVDVDEIFDAVCPQCREPRSVEPESVA